MLKHDRLGDSCRKFLWEMKPRNYVIGYFEERIPLVMESRVEAKLIGSI